MLEQVGDPLRVFDIGLAAGHCFDVLGIDDQQLQAGALENVVNRFPVDAGGFHRHVAHLLLLQPVGQLQQVVGHGAEGAHLLTAGDHDASHHCLLVHIQARTARMHHFHDSHLHSI